MVVGITRVRDEADIIEFSIRRMLTQVDAIIVGENASTDGTAEILRDSLAREFPVIVVDDKAVNWKQNEVMTAFAQRARADLGADWVVAYDTDELWYGTKGRTVKQALEELDDDVLIAQAELFNHDATTADDHDERDPFKRMEYRRKGPLGLPKIAARPRPDLSIGHGNHTCRFGNLERPGEFRRQLVARHFPYRTPEQFIKRVQIAYPMLKESGLPRDHGLHMWIYGEHLERYGEAGLRKWFNDGMLFYPDNPELVHDPAPCLMV